MVDGEKVRLVDLCADGGVIRQKGERIYYGSQEAIRFYDFGSHLAGMNSRMSKAKSIVDTANAPNSERKGRRWTIFAIKEAGGLAFRNKSGSDTNLLIWFDDNSTMMLFSDDRCIINDDCTIEQVTSYLIQASLF